MFRRKFTEEGNESQEKEEEVEEEEDVEQNDDVDGSDEEWEDEIDSDSDEEEVKSKGNQGNSKVKLKNSLLFVYQNEAQRDLLRRYGNEICLLDATYKTTRYAFHYQKKSKNMQRL